MAQESEQDICPLCGSEMTDKIIDYSDWSDGHWLVVRDVPVRECQAERHRFFQARVARALERQHKLEPVETIEVPVVKLELLV
jgi:YgiT-type zinc finger domain-containing protein